MSAKSKLRYNITPSMPKMVRVSIKMLRSAVEAKLWIVLTSEVIVLTMFPIWWLS